MDTSYSHLDDLFFQEQSSTQALDHYWATSGFDDYMKSSSTKIREEQLESETLQNAFSPSNAVSSMISLGDGLPADIPLQQFAHEYFEEALSKSTVPSLSNSLNSTPVSDNMPSTQKSTVDSYDKVLFPSVLSTNPDPIDFADLSTSNDNAEFIPMLGSFEYTSQPMKLRNLSVNSSPYQSGYSSAASPEAFASSTIKPSASVKSISTNEAPTRSGSVSSTKSRNSLDSRLSLQRLGEVLKTKSLEETMNIEKFVLHVFEKELGFPLGQKTWIRDTSESYREVLLEKLFQRVNPIHPRMTKALLETVIRRATYSMMQGRLRKERRAASKAKAMKTRQ